MDSFKNSVQVLCKVINLVFEFPSFFGRYGKVNYFNQELSMGCLQKDSKHSASNTFILTVHQRFGILNKFSRQKQFIKVCVPSLSYASLTHTLHDKTVLQFLTQQYSKRSFI